ncbi:hypothetical protein DEO72_LG8g2608 [Vigna unguiculata]|uniref:Uncharacterized protein n=1 Tax=Vigna unguiculata TaxID=3917 RepID=A0A4D6MVC6_VIGUN|nr:hypothetical protein DEO72_LG8g2608 [Vigna unguiculata]
MVARRRRCNSSSGSSRLLDGAAAVMVGRRRRSRNGTGNLLDGAGDVAALRCKRRNDDLASRRCARWWEVCVRGVQDGVRCAEFARSCAGRRRRRRIAEVRHCTLKKWGFFNPTKGHYCLG